MSHENYQPPDYIGNSNKKPVSFMAIPIDIGTMWTKPKLKITT